MRGRVEMNFDSGPTGIECVCDHDYSEHFPMHVFPEVGPDVVLSAATAGLIHCAICLCANFHKKLSDAEWRESMKR